MYILDYHSYVKLLAPVAQYMRALTPKGKLYDINGWIFLFSCAIHYRLHARVSVNICCITAEYINQITHTDVVSFIV